MTEVICLSPGHSIGNRNRSPDGSYYEWEFNQDVCDKAEAWLKQISGIRVVKVKEAHEVTDLASRVKFAHDNKAGLFLEQHTNAYGSGDWTSPNGFGVYRYPGRDLLVARMAHRHSMVLIPMNDRGIRERNFYVLRETGMPALLFETGFHTNREDLAKLKTQEFRWLQAEVLVRTSCEFAGVSFIPYRKEGEYLLTPHHFVNPGETMWRLSRTFELDLTEFQGFNTHIKDGASIKGEFGGDILFKAPPTDFEKEYAKTRAALIRTKIDLEGAADSEELKALEEKVKQLEQDKLDQSVEITDLRKAKSFYEMQMSKAGSLATSLVKITEERHE